MVKMEKIGNANAKMVLFTIFIITLGLEQSPINLPTPKLAIQSKVSPYFKYEDTPFKVEEENQNFKEGEILKIRYDKGALRISAPTFGKVVTLDGGVYQAQEIIFNTPSNHRIDDKIYDMEMQIVHKGVSKGDLAKYLILCFLFKKKAGASNKFLEKIELFNLPNPLESYRDLSSNVFIPNIMLQEQDDDLDTMVPFSFFSYQGSLQEPPCSENTIVYVASEPIPTSVYSLQLMKEALNYPDTVDSSGRKQGSEPIMNNREIQRQHGRSIFYYDSGMCNLMSKKAADVVEKGHYEKVIKPMRKYFFVDGQKPSDLPGAWVVTEKEAKGLILTP